MKKKPQSPDAAITLERDREAKRRIKRLQKSLEKKGKRGRK